MSNPGKAAINAGMIPYPPKRTAEEINKFLDRYKNSGPAPHKSVIQRHIDGNEGPAPMSGVQKYPYSALQRTYLDDFRAMVSRDLTHPYITSAVPGSASSPHDVLAAHNFDDDAVASMYGKSTTWSSEQSREYTQKDLVEAKKGFAVGVRGECLRFLS